MKPLFNRKDTIQANRSGLQAVIVEVDLFTQEYVYKYLDPTSINFFGEHRHPIDQLESHWHKVSSHCQGIIVAKSKDNCFHEWIDYLGLNERYKYCKHCDEKRF